jgi:uncharacterized protein YdeI (YjbR/CyaY-like superfamily)
VPFSGPAAFRAWLARNHARTAELFVRCAKVGAGTGLTYKQAVDEALCIGWIDGVRHSIDRASFSVRFTRRQPKSRWSTVNIRRFRELLAARRVRPPGQAAFDARLKSEYSFESRPRSLAPAHERQFRADEAAWRFFEAQPDWYRRTCAFWVASAKKEETRARRLAQLIQLSARGEGLWILKRPAAARKAPGRPSAAR